MKRTLDPRMSRRLLLGGAGVGLCLPWLPSLSRRAAAEEEGAPPRFLFYYIPNGVHLPKFIPTSGGTDWALPEILDSLEPVRQQINVWSGLQNVPELVTAAHHITGGSAMLTFTAPSADDLVLDVSVDQLIARQISTGTRFESLQLRTAGDTNPAACDDGIPCAYTDAISWAGPRAPLAPLTDPATVFEQLFSGFDPNATEKEQEKRRILQSSVLDAALSQAESLRPKLGVADQRKLEEWFTSIRTVEQEVMRVPEMPDANSVCAPPEMAPVTPTFKDQVQAMGNLMALAFECDLTRVITYQIGRTGSDRNYSFLGVAGNHHSISHHGGLQENYDMLTTINHFEVETYSYLLQRLNSSTNSDGSSLLSSTMAMLSTDVGDGDEHSQYNVPIVAAGQFGGRFATGHHLDLSGATHGSVYITLLQSLGLEIETFGQGATGTVELPTT